MTDSSKTDRIITPRVLIVFAIYLLLSPIILFISAGTMKWSLAWVYSVTTLALTVISRVFMIRKYPDLAQERANYRNAEGVKSWDRILGALVGLYGNIAIFIVAGLDKRFSWSPTIAMHISIVAIVIGIGIGFLLGYWAMIENRYFSAVVRIQNDRGHTVCTTGPYHFIRHPGYAGALLVYLLTPLMLGSLWTLIPSVLTSALLVARTALEDKTLQQELEGYVDYAKETRYRLIPGVW